MLGYCLHGLCAFPDMVIDANMPRTSGKDQERLVLEAVASTAGTSPLFCNGNSVCGVLLTWLNSQYVYFLVLFTSSLFHID